jgi:hypothetical protein
VEVGVVAFAVVGVVLTGAVAVSVTTTTVVDGAGFSTLLAAASALAMAEFGMDNPRTAQVSSSGLRSASTVTSGEQSLYMQVTTSGRKLVLRAALHMHFASVA